MPSRLVILAEEVLVQGRLDAPERTQFDALARLTHAAHPVAVILSDETMDRATPVLMQQVAGEAGGQVVAFFHRPTRGVGLTGVLSEVTERWRVDPGQVHGVFNRIEDLASLRAFGGVAVVLADRVNGTEPLPPGTQVHADLATFVNALLNETEAPS